MGLLDGQFPPFVGRRLTARCSELCILMWDFRLTSHILGNNFMYPRAFRRFEFTLWFWSLRWVSLRIHLRHRFDRFLHYPSMVCTVPPVSSRHTSTVLFFLFRDKPLSVDCSNDSLHFFSLLAASRQLDEILHSILRIENLRFGDNRRTIAREKTCATWMHSSATFHGGIKPNRCT